MPGGFGCPWELAALPLWILLQLWLIDSSPQPSNISSACMQNSKNIYSDNIFMLARQRIPLCQRFHKQPVNKNIHSKKPPNHKTKTKPLLRVWDTQIPTTTIEKTCTLEEPCKLQQLVHRTILCNCESNFSLLLSRIKSQSKFSMRKNCTFLAQYLLLPHQQNCWCWFCSWEINQLLSRQIRFSIRWRYREFSKEEQQCGRGSDSQHCPWLE